ncbi:MAG: hypothetical protein J6113_05785 [Lachnospiraceae bacterium]|nr:hypothetical protein [Lachnospiraceae bacterium]
MKKGDNPRNIISRITGAALALIMVLCLVLPSFGTVTKANAADPRFEINITYGFNNQARLYCNIPFNIKITNKGGDFEGTVQIIVPTNDGNDMYEKDLALAAGATKTVTLTVPVNNYLTSANIRICNHKGKPVQTQSLSIKLIRSIDEINIGVLSDDFSALSYLSGIELYSNNGVTIKTRIYELTEDNFPQDAKSFNMLDFVLISNYSTDKLSDTQLSALNLWINEGGAVILGTGSTVSKTLSGLKNLSAFRALRPETVSFKTYKTTYGIPFAAAENLSISPISGSGYGYDYRYDELSSYGASVYATVLQLCSDAAETAHEKVEAREVAGPLDGELVFEYLYMQSSEYLWNQFGYNYGFDPEDFKQSQDPYFEMKFKDILFSSLLEPFCSDAAFVYSNQSSHGTTVTDQDYVNAEITSIDIDMRCYTVEGDIYGHYDNDAYDLFRVYNYGSGSIGIASMDFTQNPFASYQNNRTVTRMLLKDAFGTMLVSLINNYDKNGNYWSSSSFGRFFEPLASAGTAPVLLYVLILIAYLVITLVSFAILKKKRKNVWFWVSQTALALVFGILIFFLSFTTKISSPELRSAQLIELTGQAEERTLVSGFLTPSGKRYSLTILNKYNFKRESKESGYFYPNPSVNPSLDDYHIGINIHAEDSTYLINNKYALQTEYFSGKFTDAEKQGSFTTEGDVTDLTPLLNVTNNTGYDLERVIVIAPAMIYYLGDLANGASATLDSNTPGINHRYYHRTASDITPQEYLREGETAPLLRVLFGADQEGYKRTMLRLFLFEELSSRYNNVGYIVLGFPAKEPQVQLQTNKKYKEFSHSVVFQRFGTDPSSYVFID